MFRDFFNSGASGRTTPTIKLHVDGRIVEVPVSRELKAYFNEQFKTNTSNQTARKTTFFNILRAAYKKGAEDGKKQAAAKP